MLLWFVKIYERNLKKLQFTTQCMFQIIMQIIFSNISQIITLEAMKLSQFLHYTILSIILVHFCKLQHKLKVTRRSILYAMLNP